MEREKRERRGGEVGGERERERERERESTVPFPSCEYTKHVMFALLNSLSGFFCMSTVQCVQ